MNEEFHDEDDDCDSVKIGQIKTLAYLKVSTSLLSNGMGTQFLFLYNSCWKLPQNISGIFSHKIVLIWIITVRSFSIIWVIKRFSCLDNSTLLCTNLPITFLPEASSKTFWQNHTRSFIHDFKTFTESRLFVTFVQYQDVTGLKAKWYPFQRNL